MCGDKSIFGILSQKLGVERKITAKASELNELLEARAGTTSLAALRLTGSCRHVICLDLAAKAEGCTLNRSDVVKLSSMNKKSYEEAVKVIASMLDLEETLTIRELAIQFGCTGAVALATDTLQSYVSEQCCDVDFNAPMFLCAALIVACRKLKIKIDVVKLKEKSGTRKATLDRLIAQLEKHAAKTADRKRQTPSKKRGGLMETIEAQIEEEDRAAKKPRLEDDKENDEGKKKTTSVAEYEEWKRKILAKAALTPS